MPVEKIVIVGGGTAGWLSAAYLDHSVNRAEARGVEITLVESADIGVIGVGEATVPNLRQTLLRLGLDEEEFMRQTSATFKQAIKFQNWRVSPSVDPDDHFYHPFEYPEQVDDLEFTPLWLIYRDTGGGEPYDHACSPAPAMCDALRAPKSSTSRPYFGTVNYAYHLDAVQFGRYLREMATSRGVKRVVDTVGTVNIDERGYVESIETKDNGRLAADLFVDCSGFKGLLINEALGEPFIGFGDSLLCDRAVAIQTPYGQGNRTINPFTTATAMSAGWTWDIQLYERRGSGYVYSSAFVSDDQAEAELRAFLGAAADGANARRLRMRVGRNLIPTGINQNPWAHFRRPIDMILQG